MTGRIDAERRELPGRAGPWGETGARPGIAHAHVLDEHSKVPTSGGKELGRRSGRLNRRWSGGLSVDEDQLALDHNVPRWLPAEPGNERLHGSCTELREWHPHRG